MGRDRIGHIIAGVTLAGQHSRDIGLKLIARGLVGAGADAPHHCSAAERRARRRRLGIWEDGLAAFRTGRCEPARVA